MSFALIVKDPSSTTNVTFEKFFEVFLNWSLVNPIAYVSAFVPFASAVPVNLKSSVEYFVSLILATSYPVTDCSVPSYVLVALLPVIVTTTSASSGVIVNEPISSNTS